MKSPEINQEVAAEILERIEFNSFLRGEVGYTMAGSIEPADLLTEKEIEREKEKHAKRDGFYERFSIAAILKFCLDGKKFKFENGVAEIDSEIDLKLPEGYGFKGGAARNVLRESLGLRNNEPRDYDLIRVTEREAYEGADYELAHAYMEKDFEFGDGVEFLFDRERYFATRDFTINEVYVLNNKVFATEQCIRDTLRGIIRATDYEMDTDDPFGSGLGPKIKSKALRLHAEHLYTIGVSNIYNADRQEIEGSFINPFWLAVQLDRAFERSVLIANRFTELLKKMKIIPDDIKDAMNLVGYLEREIDRDFYFRSVPAATYVLEDAYSERENLGEVDAAEYWEEYFDSLV